MNFIEVCAGCGGLSTGLKNAGFIPLFISDIDKNCVETLKLNHDNANYIHCEDMKTTSLTQYDDVHLLCGGVPCQSFSQAGERKGLDDPRGQLIIEFNRLINECNPQMFLIENVKGLVHHNGGDTIKQVTEMLSNNHKYKVCFKVLNAWNYDVPQKRERVFIVGKRNDIEADYSYPEHVETKPVLKDALRDVPDSPGVKYNKKKFDVMKLVPPGGCWVNLPEDVKEEYMGAALHSGGGKRGMARRLSLDEPCLTLTTSPHQKQTERCHPSETRPFTIREYARIQTFPDSFKFYGATGNQYKQIGNAVPVNLAYHIGKSISKTLNS